MVDIVTRAEWGARPPKRTPAHIKLPSRDLWLHHTASADGGAQRVRAIQDFHMDVRNWNDIAYSYLVNQGGMIFEGRGAGIAGGHTQGHNTTSHAICVMGNFDYDVPTKAALASVVELARHGYTQGWWPDQFTGGHKDASGASTSCPGINLYVLIPSINQALRGGDDMTPEQATQLSEVHTILTKPLLGGPTTPTAAQAWNRTYNLVKAQVDEDLTDEDLARIAKAVADEQARRQQA